MFYEKKDKTPEEIEDDLKPVDPGFGVDPDGDGIRTHALTQQRQILLLLLKYLIHININE